MSNVIKFWNQLLSHTVYSNTEDAKTVAQISSHLFNVSWNSVYFPLERKVFATG